MLPQKAIVVGAGIVGLATARALAIKGYRLLSLIKPRKLLGLLSETLVCFGQLVNQMVVYTKELNEPNKFG